MLTRTLSFVMESFDSETREFRFNRLICADVGRPVLNDAKKKYTEEILKYIVGTISLINWNVIIEIGKKY